MRHKCIKVFRLSAAIVIGLFLMGFGVFALNAFLNKQTTIQFDGFNTATVYRSDIQEDSIVTGIVSADKNVDLAFQESGRIVSVSAPVGTSVHTGDIIGQLDTADIRAQEKGVAADFAAALAQADYLKAQRKNAEYGSIQSQQTLVGQQAVLDELLHGARKEDVDTEKTALSNAKANLEQAQNSLAASQEKEQIDLQSIYDGVQNLLQDADVKARDAVLTQLDPLFDNDTDQNPHLSFFTTDAQSAIDAASQRLSAQQDLNALDSSVNSLPNDHDGLDSALAQISAHLQAFIPLFQKVSFALGSAANIPQTTIDGYKIAVTGAATEINTEISLIKQTQSALAKQKATNQADLLQAQAHVTDAQHAILSAAAALTLKEAGARPEEIAAQQALVQKAKTGENIQEQQVHEIDAQIQAQQAAIQKIKAHMQELGVLEDQATLRSPLDGIVTRNDMNNGMVVSPSVALVSIISNGNFQIDTFVPEVDVAHVHVGQHADVTLDAYGRTVVFPAIVVMVDPSDTLQHGIATYKTTLQFSEKDDRIKEGMTATITILGDVHTHALVIPESAVFQKNSESFVRIQNGTTQRDVFIHPGIRGEHGMIEVLDGIQEGDRVIVSQNHI